MTDELPLWLAITITAFLLWGSGLTLIGAIGLTRGKTFYDRLHMPTLGTSWGVGGIIIASIIYSTMVEHRLVSHELLLAIFLIVTTPVTLMLLSRAAMQRDQSSNSPEVPSELRYRELNDNSVTATNLEETVDTGAQDSKA